MSAHLEPQGVIVILTGPDGYVWATAVDFARGAPCGYSQSGAQEMRAKSALAHEYIRLSCHEMIAKVMRTLNVFPALKDGDFLNRTLTFEREA